MAEVLANMALRRGDELQVPYAVLDEFHYYSDPARGWARGGCRCCSLHQTTFC
jgi:superfamily II RNA helicase